MTDLEALRGLITTILNTHLGTYTFSNGLSTAAIRIEDGADPFDEEPSATGLEIVVRPDQNLELTALLSNDKRLDTTIFITLKQWDVAATTKTARELLIQELPIDRIESLVPRNTRLDAIETCTLAMDDDYYFLG